MNTLEKGNERWYDGITRYQWIVFAIACLGWIFDVFEGQIFAVYKSPAMADLLGVAKDDPLVDWFGNMGFASFLIGGAFGGLVFGMLADKVGRRKSMVWSILTYSLFTGLHFFATNPWHIVILRFFVAMGVAGEWAIAASLVAEVFPKKARALAGGIFHASSVLGAVLAAGIGMILVDKSDWRPAFLVGLLPGLLVVWVLVSLKESEKWQSATTAESEEGAKKKKAGSLFELLGPGPWRSRALIGLGLASIGLGTYWGIYAWGPELVHEVLRPTRPMEFWWEDAGQELILAFDDGPESRELGTWLATTLPNTFASGDDDLTGKTNAEIAATLRSLAPTKSDVAHEDKAALLSVALMTYATSEALAGDTAKEYGFLTSEKGLGATALYGEDLGVAFAGQGGEGITILEALKATDRPDTAGLLAVVPVDAEDSEAGESPTLLAADVYSDAMAQESQKAGSFAYLIMNFTGGLIGLVLFAPITMVTNRRITFAFYHVGALIAVPFTFLGCTAYWHTMVMLPVTAFFVVGMHAGYAIYFPELFPTHLRATGASFCFNVGRFVSAFMLLVRGQLREMLGLRWAVTVMASLFLVGLVLLIFAPETKDTDLPE